jgi:hypothetical protein
VSKHRSIGLPNNADDISGDLYVPPEGGVA